MRSELLSYLTTATSTSTIKTVSELPWNTAGEPLYLKNMKKFYLDEEQMEDKRDNSKHPEPVPRSNICQDNK